MVVIHDNAQQEPAAIGPHWCSLRLFSIHINYCSHRLNLCSKYFFWSQSAACHCFRNSLSFLQENCQGAEREFTSKPFPYKPLAGDNLRVKPLTCLVWSLQGLAALHWTGAQSWFELTLREPPPTPTSPKTNLGLWNAADEEQGARKIMFCWRYFLTLVTTLMPSRRHSCRQLCAGEGGLQWAVPMDDCDY